MSRIYEKSKFIEYLRDTPLVSFACKKVGIARATYYRWFKDDKDFREQIQEVLHHGRQNINDLAEATLIKLMKKENFNAIRFWLQHNKKQYVPVRTHYIPPPTHSHVELKPGETCSFCGTKKPKNPAVQKKMGYYENQPEGNINKSDDVDKKKKKMNSKERKEVARKMIYKRQEIERYEELGETFPEYKQLAEDMRSGKVEPPPPHGKPREYIRKEDRPENIELDIDFD